MSRLLVGLLAAIMIGAIGCGGDSDDSATTPGPTSTGDASDSDPTNTPEPSDADDGDDASQSAPAEGEATVTLGDVTWEFALSGDAREMCNPNFSGLFFVSMFTQDENGDEIVFSLTAPAGAGTGVVQAGATLINGELWIADTSVYDTFPDLPEGVDASVQIDGNSATGSATFYEDRALQATRQSGGTYEGELREGTFAVTCAS